MSRLRKYLRRHGTPVIAVQLDLDTDGFTYRKWGGVQSAAARDWLVDNDGDIYTVERETFERTYRRLAPGVFVKDKPVWARQAKEKGSIETREGTTDYEAGDMIVFNDPDEHDGYAMTAAKFGSLYELDD